jgi:hypothetical protein
MGRRFPIAETAQGLAVTFVPAAPSSPRGDSLLGASTGPGKLQNPVDRRGNGALVVCDLVCQTRSDISS